MLVYQILNGLPNVDLSFFFPETFYQATRGQNFKLIKQQFHKNVKSHALLLRVINNWNSLPGYIVNTNSLTSFKKLLLDEYWTDYHYFFND